VQPETIQQPDVIQKVEVRPAPVIVREPAPQVIEARPVVVEPPRPMEPRKRWNRPPLFAELFKKGDEIIVQVIKEEIGMKGARISTFISLPGRYLVLLPYPNEEGGISRKVEDINERKRLKRILREISSDRTAFIIRTAGIYREEKDMLSDVEFLSHEWATIAEKARQAEIASLVYDDHDIVYRLARDVFDDNISEILIDSHVESEKLRGLLAKLIPTLVDKVKVYSGPENIFLKYGVEKQIQKAARRKVWLKSGGYIIIDEAEALTAIDVNTGKSIGKDDQEKLILKTNLEAARTVARELKLRDIGGLIVIDFIDMKDSRNREQVLAELRANLRTDRSKTSVSTMSEFGLVEMTRKRVRRSLRKTLFMDCHYCQGAGVILNEQQIWLHIKHEIVRMLEAQRPAPSLLITVNPKIRGYIDQNYREVIRRLEQKYETEIRVLMSDVIHVENYSIEKQGENTPPVMHGSGYGGSNTATATSEAVPMGASGGR
jgi:ribonuclease G